MLEGFQKYHVTVTVDNSSMHLYEEYQQKLNLHQWSFLVPLIGGRYHIIPQLAIYKWYISGIFPANWGIIWYLPPIKGTRKLHWFKAEPNPYPYLHHVPPPSSRRTAPSVATYQRPAVKARSGVWGFVVKVVLEKISVDLLLDWTWHI